MQTFSFATAFTADVVDLPGFNSKHFANSSCTERHTAFNLREIMKKCDLLISRCASAPFLGA
jgi:hypothetical protein